VGYWVYHDRLAHFKAIKDAEILAASVREEQEKAKRIASGNNLGAAATLMPKLPPGVSSHGGYNSM